MAKDALASRRFVPTPEEAQKGALPLSKEEIVNALAAYKRQNPAKYEAKKASLLKRYGLADLPEAEPDESDKELETLKVKVKKNGK